MATILEGRSGRPTKAKGRQRGQAEHQCSTPRPMSREDIANVEPVSAGEVLEVLDGAGLEAGGQQVMAIAITSDRWTLAEGGAA